MTSFGLSTTAPSLLPEVLVGFDSDNIRAILERRKSVWLWKAESKLSVVSLARLVGKAGKGPNRGSSEEWRDCFVSMDGRCVPDTSAEFSVASGSELEEVEGNASASSVPPSFTELLGFHPTQMPAHTMHTSSYILQGSTQEEVACE
jgi:hypothetical protein